MQNMTTSILKISIPNQIEEIIAVVDRQTMLYELFDYLIDQKHLDQKQYWVCYSNTSLQFLTDVYSIPWITKPEDYLVFISTPRANSALRSQKYSYQQQNSALSTQLEGSKMEEEDNIQIGQNFSIQIQVQDGSFFRHFKIMINENETLDYIAYFILDILGLESSIAAIDLFIFGSHYNSYQRRMRTLKQLNFRNDFVITAKVRWIGG